MNAPCLWNLWKQHRSGVKTFLFAVGCFFDNYNYSLMNQGWTGKL
jgi:hypothetical protein